MRVVCLILFVLGALFVKAQQGFTFTRFTTEDGSGLSSNVVSSIYQDPKGFIWVGTANGLQRFDGSKFIQFGIGSGDPMPYSVVSQILPYEDGQLFLYFGALHELGIFNPANFSYKRIEVRTNKPFSPKSDYHLFRDSRGEFYLNIFHYNVLQFNKK